MQYASLAWGVDAPVRGSSRKTVYVNILRLPTVPYKP